MPQDKIESYKNAQKNGQMLSFEQLSLVARLDDVHSTLKNLLDMQKQFDYIALDTERDRQQLALEAELKRTHQDIAKIKEILLIQVAQTLYIYSYFCF
ncbi:hypothetical protein PR048_004709 [Dryococelus australis]|uniref:Uncharacterized protein n=1 Tax=Dryococelus australis TaxID=614101 RepID=A0ABQ9I647_9NEOP|nr:hypothetical protein PR048_004709 [Dryococelus australis]